MRIKRRQACESTNSGIPRHTKREQQLCEGSDELAESEWIVVRKQQ